MLPPEIVIALLNTFAPIVRETIIAFQKSHDGRMPTDEEMSAEFEANADRILAEGAAWKASHPNA